MGVFVTDALRPFLGVQKLLQADRRKLGQNVFALRKKIGLTQEQVAEQAGIDRRFIQKVEVGELGTSLAILKRLRKVLRASWDELLYGL